jgi:hypothetical protein
MLCWRCGGSTWEPISDTEERCAECGHRSTFQRLVAQRGDDESLEESRASAARIRALENQFTGPPPGFADATFPVFGLDDTWHGLRWFGGSGGSPGQAIALELAHGDAPWDLTAPQVRVQTQTPGDFQGVDSNVGLAHEAAMLARTQVQRFWSATHTLPDPVRAAAFPRDGTWHDPTGPWQRELVPVNAHPVEFRVLGDDRYWVAQTIHDGVVSGIEARAWAVANTALITVTDFEPYVAGAREIRNRWPSR